VERRPSPSPPIIVTPLEFERRILERRLRRLRRTGRCPPCCCGPGPEAVQRWAAGVTPHANQPVLLAGLAGSLKKTFATRSAHLAGAVVGEEGTRWEPSFSAARGPDDRSPPVIASAPATLTTPQAKRAWADRSGADLVDRESAAFADAATRHGWRWAIVRGVSDGPDTPLPHDIDAWIDDHGRTRFGIVWRSLALRPGRMGQVFRLRADSVAAMQAVARVIQRLVE
jgi:hypothetical protein